MKKLFTLCASALLAFTLSAQSEHAQGSIYLGTGDATNFGELVREAQANTAASDPTRGLVFGAYSQQNSASYNIIQYV